MLLDFPFADQASKPNAVGALLTPIVREMVDGPTPMHAIDAPTPGSGKGLLTEVIAYVTSGHPAGVTSLPRDDDELRKRITAFLRDSADVIVFDNVNRELDSPTLAAAITSTVWSDRVLGVSTTGRFPNRALWIATGNNLRVSGELVRRMVQIRIDPRVDRPWERSGFRHDPLMVWVRERRHELVWALLVLVRHWIAVGRPAWSGKPMGSFEAWCQTVGGVLEAAGINGFLGNRDQLYRQSDAESDEWRDFTSVWWERFGDRPVQTADLYPLLGEHDLLPSLFKTVRGEASERSVRTRLGTAVMARRDRAFGDLFIRELGSDGHRKGKVFGLARAEPRVGEGPGSAEVPRPIRPALSSDAGPAEPAEPVSDPRGGVDVGATPVVSESDVRESARVPDQVPQVPRGAGSSSDSGDADAEPARLTPSEVPHQVPQHRDDRPPRVPCLGGCGRLVAPGQKCSPCAEAATMEWQRRKGRRK